jgi:hypothetical protein
VSGDCFFCWPAANIAFSSIHSLGSPAHESSYSWKMRSTVAASDGSIARPPADTLLPVSDFTTR